MRKESTCALAETFVQCPYNYHLPYPFSLESELQMRLLTLLIITLAALDAAANDAVVDASKYESLQAAADAVPVTGGVLQIPPGTYELHEPLRICTGDTQIAGRGTATHIINMNTDGQPAILIEHPDYANKATPSKERLWRVSVMNLRVTGNGESGAGIDARYIEEFVVKDVSSSYHGGDGIRLHFCYEDPRLSDNLLTYNKGSGISLEGCHDIVVSANQFEENLDGLKCIDSFNLTMTGNNLDDHLRDGIVIENTYGSVVSGNMIEECQGWAVVLDRDCYGNNISANVIAHDFAGGIDLRDAHGCAVSANTFTIVKKTAIAVREESGSITISANNFSDTWIGKDKNGMPAGKRKNEPTKAEQNPNEAAGILLENCVGVVISGNIFSRLSTEAVMRKGNCRKILLNANGLYKDE